MKPARGHARGARSLIIGVANIGGTLNPEWMPALIEALEAGPRHRQRHACAARRTIASSTPLRSARPPPDRRAHARRGNSDRDRDASAAASDCSRSAPTARSARSTPPWCWRGSSPPRPRRGFSRDRPDRHPHRRRGHAARCVVADFVAGAAEVLSPTPTPTTGTSSKARARCSTRRTPAFRWACCMARSPM